MGRILRRNSLRINILTSDSFGWNILRGEIITVSLFSISCVVWGSGEVPAHLHRFVPEMVRTEDPGKISFW
jgi:hypothetical protein